MFYHYFLLLLVTMLSSCTYSPVQYRSQKKEFEKLINYLNIKNIYENIKMKRRSSLGQVSSRDKFKTFINYGFDNDKKGFNGNWKQSYSCYLNELRKNNVIPFDIFLYDEKQFRALKEKSIIEALNNCPSLHKIDIYKKMNELSIISKHSQDIVDFPSQFTADLLRFALALYVEKKQN